MNEHLDQNISIDPTRGTTTHEHHLILVRAIWWIVALLAFGLIAVGVPARYAQLTTVSSSANTLIGQLRPDEARALEQAGISVTFYAVYFTALYTLFTLLFASTGLALAWLRPKDRAALLISLSLIGMGLTAVTVGMTQPRWHLAFIAVRAVWYASSMPALYLFPDGRFVPRWTRWLTAIWLIYTVVWLIFPAISPPFGFGQGFTGSELPRNLWILFWICSGLAAQIYRYRHVSNAIERQQIKWVEFGFGSFVILWVIGVSTITLTQLAPLGGTIMIAKLVGTSIVLMGELTLPLALGASILRYQLFDIDILISRTLVYGTLSVGIVMTYILLVGLLGTLLNTHVSLAAAFVTAALTVPFFQPLRLRLQRALDRLTFGGRDMPNPPHEIKETQPNFEMPLHQRWLEVIHSAWFVCAVLVGIILIGAVPVYYSHVARPVITDPYNLGQFNVPFQVLIGLSDLASSVLSFALAILLFWRKPNDRMALLVSFFFLITAVTSNDTLDYFLMTYVGAASTRVIYSHLQTPWWILLGCIFPDGRFVPRWTRWLFLFSILASFSFLASPEWRVILDTVAFPQFMLTMYAQVYRYRRVSSAGERQQTKWFVFGVLMSGAFFVIGLLIYKKLGPPLINIIPLTLAIAILRSRLWDIDLILNRALVYGALTAGIVALYILLVGALSLLSQTTGNLLISLLATGLIAFLFQPLRERLQRGVNRLVYGERDDPYAVLSRLGQRLEAAYAPVSVLPTIVETIAQTLKLPYVAIALNEDGEFKVAAEFGRSKTEPANLPLNYQGEPVGELILAPRAPGEHFTPAERQLLDDLARQAGVAVHAMRLTADLQRSRERLVAAREEERRRLRRDLHDGLGPQLASLALKLETARNRMADDPQAAALLTDLSARTQDAVADIRRLVYALRPPALDELGLVMALHEGATQYNQQGINGLNITFDAPEHLPPLPAAVEVAVYRIAQEALTNVVRHAEAHTCLVRLRLDESVGLLCLEIKDDGKGLPMKPRAGVGLSSMRERAEELGGTLTITSLSTNGTSVLARLPCRVNEASHRVNGNTSDASQKEA